MQQLLSKKDQQEVSSLLAQRLGNSSNKLQLLAFTPAAIDSCMYCDHLKELLSELAALSNGRITTKSVVLEESKELAEKYRVKRAPATVVTIDGSNSLEPFVKFYGLPSGHEFSALLEDIFDIGHRRPSGLSAEAVEKMKSLKSKVHIQVFVTPTCPYCPRAVRTAHQLSIANPSMVDADMIESTEFPELAEKYSVMAVPKIVINEDVEFEGALPEYMFLSKIEEALSSTQSSGMSAKQIITQGTKPIVLSDSIFFDTINKSHLMVVDFWAPWCAPCRMVSPVLEKLAGEYVGKVTFGKLNVDENPVVSGQFQVQSIPTILIFKDGNVVDGVVGAAPRDVFESKIKAQMAAEAEPSPYHDKR